MSSDPLARLPVYLGRAGLAAAAVLALYLGVASLTRAEVAGCGEGGACQGVLTSRWSHVFGVPVSLAGAAVYLLLLVLDWRDRFPAVRLLLALLVAGAAAWFLLVQAVLLRAFCPWCCTAHGLALLGCVLLLVSGRLRVAPARGALPPLVWALPAAGMALGLLAAIQFTGAERAPATARRALGEGGVSVRPADPTRPEVRSIGLYNGEFSYTSDSVPALGDPGRAAHVAVGLFDYTCKHCRHLHGILDRLVAEFAPDLAVVRLPAHYSAKARQIHQLMLVLWHGEREAHDAVSHALHEGSLAAQPDRVREAIVARIGEPRLADLEAAYGSRAETLLDSAAGLMARNKKATRITKLPQLMFGDEVEVGQDPNPGHYYALFAEKFGLRRTRVARLVVEPAEFDMGRIIAGSLHTLEFTLSNRGNAPAVFSGIQVPQGLQWLGDRPTGLGPGESVELSLRAETPYQRGPARAPLVLTSDGEPSRLEFFMKAEIENPFRFTPESLDLGRLQAGGPGLPARVRIEVPPDVRLGAPSSTRPEFRARLDPRADDGSYLLYVTPVLTGGPGYKRALITLPVTPPEGTGETWPEAVRYPVRFVLTRQG